MGNKNKFFGQFTGGGSGSGTSVTLKTNSVNNSDQTILNLTAGSNIGIVAGATGLVTISSSAGTSITLQTNYVNNASQTILNLIQGNGILITDNGGGNVGIEEKYPTYFRNIAIKPLALAITTNGSQITYEIALPNISYSIFLWELESRFYQYLLTNVDISVHISTTSGTIGTMIAKGEKFTGTNNLSAINRTFYNVSNTILNGLQSSKFGQPTDYEPQTYTNELQSYTIDSTIPQFIQFVVSINDFPVPVGAFASLDFCKFTLTKVS